MHSDNKKKLFNCPLHYKNKFHAGIHTKTPDLSSKVNVNKCPSPTIQTRTL